MEQAKLFNTYYDCFRRKYLKDSNDITYFAKANICPKTKEINNYYLCNELIYNFIANKVNLRIPNYKLMTLDNNIYFCSEYLLSRQDLGRSGKKLDDVFLYYNNLRQILTALILDLALMNNDRAKWNILIDTEKNLYFIDHDKCLLGDGGLDKHRFSLGFEERFTNFLGDFLQYKDANSYLFYYWDLIGREILERLHSYYLEALLSVELDVKEYHLYFNQLKIWWDFLFNYFSKDNKHKLKELLISRNRL